MTDDLSQYLEEAARLKTEIADIEQTLKDYKKRLTEASNAIVKTLEVMSLEKVSGHGFTFYVETKSSVKTPKSNEDKEKLFEFLKERGIFMEFASVNSQSLNSLYKTLSSEAEAEGNLEFELPGVEAPNYYQTLKMRKS